MSVENNHLENLRKIKQQDTKVLLRKAYRGIWETAIKKYSDTAHFVFELLQNADDTQATWVSFTIDADGLWFKHNGKIRFTISDPASEEDDSENGTLGHINAITSIGNSSKVDEQKIGKFGIGFKAVFAYSSTPHVYDDNFNFRLDNYIVPVKIEPNTTHRKKGETLFYFPFNLETKPSSEAYSEIESKLESLFQPILFLSHIQKIDWTSVEKSGEYSKRTVKTIAFEKISASLVEVKNVVDGSSTIEHLWLFSQGIIHTTLKSKHKIIVGFFVLENNVLETGYKYDAFCFFPTKEETDLGFIIQAPFLLTDSREGIKAGNGWNKALVQLVADLAANSIVLLKKIGEQEKANLITDKILDLIPYRETDFSDVNNNSKISFKPFFTSIRQKFKTEQILPGTNGKYFSTQKAYWASDPELAELFSDEQISLLMDNPDSGWVFCSKGQKQMNQANKPLESYISSLITETLDPKKLLRRITADFIECQSDDWMLKFYSYLAGRRSLWDDKDKLALKRPILLNQARKAIVPFDENLTAPNIFIPSDRLSSYDTIYKPFTESEEALEFFKSLGLGKVDLRAEIFKTIIPQYNNDFNYDDTELVLRHFEAFMSYYENCPASLRVDYITHLQKIQFIAASKSSEPNTRFFCTPQDVYFPNERLNIYFEKSSDVYLLDEEFYSDFLSGLHKDKFHNFLQALGLSFIPKIREIQLATSAHVKEQFGLERYQVSFTHYQRQSITDKRLDGLSDALEEINLERSVIIWDYLLHYFQGKNIAAASTELAGIYKYVPRNHTYLYQSKFESTLEALLKNENWLFNKNGDPLPVSKLSIESLNDAYNIEDRYASVLLEYLGIESPDGDLELTDEQKKALTLGRKIIDEGYTEEEINEVLRTLAARKRDAPNKEKETDDDNVSTTEKEVEEMIAKLKKGIKKKRSENAKKNPQQEEVPIPETLEPPQDQDEFLKPSVDYQKKISKLKLEAESAIEDLTRIEKLNETVENAEKYSFAWFKALLELEYLSSSESNSQGKQISIQFAKVEKETGTDRTLILKHPNRYIPLSIEDIGDLQVRLYLGEETKSITVEVVSVKEYTLRAKLKKSADISGIDLDKVSRAVIDVKNPVFILEELRKAFLELEFDDDYNLQENLTDDIRFIFGPPGTGKTTYLATNEIIPLMKEESDVKILVLTPTNKAADVLTKRIIERMGSDESYYNWLLRFGTTGDAELENTSLVKDKNFDIRTKPRNTTITTVARFAYDYFQPDGLGERFHLKELDWDYIIVDEASMVSLASIAYILHKQVDAKFIIAGDPFQIQPITQVEQWKDQNIYSMVQLDRFVDPVTIPHQFEIINLQRQYRSIPSIGNVFSHFTYNGILEHDRSFSDQKELSIPGLNFSDVNVIKFPVSKFESIYKPNTLNKSSYQIYSALFAVEFVNNLSIQILKTHKDKFRIGVICPYKAQATLIEKLIAQHRSENEKTEIMVGTIHGFQGDECDIIIALFNPPLSITRSPAMFLNKQNILNVSISRARDYLFVLMPDDNTHDIDNLHKIKKIESLIHKHSAERLSVYTAEEIEEKLFGSKTYIYDNSFATSHQPVNVYSKPEKKYEVRCEEVAVDVQIKA